MTFAHPGDSHQHSREILDLLYEYDDFMSSIQTVVDLGCGSGDDLAWWASATTRDDEPTPLNIACTGIDLAVQSPIVHNLPNISYQSANFEGSVSHPDRGFDILWCHDAFQYAHNPLNTLANWWHMASEGAMLVLSVPVTQSIHHRQLAYELPAGQYFHYSMVSLIYMLASTGWDCGAGFFKQAPGDPWIQAVVYKSVYPPLDLSQASWHRLVELKLLPESAEVSILAHNHLRQQDLVVPWMDRTLLSMHIG
jgi:SAM-dependent methyltransferase